MNNIRLDDLKKCIETVFIRGIQVHLKYLHGAGEITPGSIVRLRWKRSYVQSLTPKFEYDTATLWTLQVWEPTKSYTQPWMPSKAQLKTQVFLNLQTKCSLPGPLRLSSHRWNYGMTFAQIIQASELRIGHFYNALLWLYRFCSSLDQITACPVMRLSLILKKCKHNK